MMNMNTPAASAPAMGKPTSDTKVKKSIMYVYLPTQSGAVIP
jgi:hypothetical protein